MIDAFLLGPLAGFRVFARLRRVYATGLLLWMLGRRARSPSVSFIGYWFTGMSVFSKSGVISAMDIPVGAIHRS
ncbi:MAG: hypothetical protein ACLS6O_00560 [Bifidobacterium sp.]